MAEAAQLVVRKRLNVTPYLLVAPALTLITLFLAIPAVLSLVASFFSIPLGGGSWSWVGFGNYAQLFSQPAVMQSLWNTVSYSFMTIVPSLVFGFLLALGANQLRRGRWIAQTMLILPLTANLVAMGVVFKWIFAFQGGIVNQSLALFGVGALNWVGDANTSLVTIAMVGIWRNTSLCMLIFLAGLAAIPGTIHEATAVDGIRGFTKLRTVIIPMMKPTFVFVTVLSVLYAVQVFDTVKVMTQGGPLGSSETILTMTWKIGFSFFELGQASALSFLLLAFLILLSLLRLRSLTKGNS